MKIAGFPVVKTQTISRRTRGRTHRGPVVISRRTRGRTHR